MTATMNNIFALSHITIMDEGDNFIQFQDESGTRKDPTIFGVFIYIEEKHVLACALIPEKSGFVEVGQGKLYTAVPDMEKAYIAGAWQTYGTDIKEMVKTLFNEKAQGTWVYSEETEEEYPQLYKSFTMSEVKTSGLEKFF